MNDRRGHTPALTALLIAIAVSIAACSTTPTARDEARPADAVVPYSMTKPTVGSGTLTVRRDLGFLGKGCDHVVRIDGKFIAQLNTGQQVTLYPPLGEHSIEVQTTGTWCGAPQSVGANVMLIAGKAKVFRTGMNAGGPTVQEGADE